MFQGKNDQKRKKWEHLTPIVARRAAGLKPAASYLSSASRLLDGLLEMLSVLLLGLFSKLVAPLPYGLRPGANVAGGETRRHFIWKPIRSPMNTPISKLQIESRGRLNLNLLSVIQFKPTLSILFPSNILYPNTYLGRAEQKQWVPNSRPKTDLDPTDSDPE